MDADIFAVSIFTFFLQPPTRYCRHFLFILPRSAWYHAFENPRHGARCLTSFISSQDQQSCRCGRRYVQNSVNLCILSQCYFGSYSTAHCLEPGACRKHVVTLFLRKYPRKVGILIQAMLFVALLPHCSHYLCHRAASELQQRASGLISDHWRYISTISGMYTCTVSPRVRILTSAL